MILPPRWTRAKRRRWRRHLAASQPQPDGQNRAPDAPAAKTARSPRMTSAKRFRGCSRILIIIAHPDDVDFGAAGTVATWTDAGIEVSYCIVTDGDAGGYDEAVDRAAMAPLRRAEQTAAAKHVGVDDVRFLGYPDGRVEATLGLRKDLARVIRQVTAAPADVSRRPSGTTCGSARATRTIAPSAPRPWTRSTRTRATRSRSPNCSPTKGSAPGP